MRWQSVEPLRSVAWHHEGKYFVSSHTDGSLCTWPLRPTPKPQFHSYPHGKYNLSNIMYDVFNMYIIYIMIMHIWNIVEHIMLLRDN